MGNYLQEIMKYRWLLTEGKHDEGQRGQNNNDMINNICGKIFYKEVTQWEKY